MEEIFDVCDEHDRVIGQAPRSEVHARGLLHRAVHVFVFNSAGELLLQMRSRHKDEAPLQFTSSASGHLGTGETYEAAAPRELLEELGIEAPLEYVCKLSAAPETAREHTVLYRTTTDAPPVIDTFEIDAVSFHPLADVAAWIEREPSRFSVCFQTLFAWYFEKIAGGPPLDFSHLRSRPVGS
ncbi:MAG: NUDIX hydrolase [Planctomycetaceae bacterium]|jgi:isopentenyl-diphosphate delta-isomerase